ncbi:hypothetical protein ABK040_002313 [Willaertia magna]
MGNSSSDNKTEQLTQQIARQNEVIENLQKELSLAKENINTHKRKLSQFNEGTINNNINNPQNDQKKIKRRSNISTTSLSSTRSAVTNNNTTKTEPKKIVICFSGFKNTTDKFNKILKKELVQIASEIPNVAVNEENGNRDTLPSDVTHVIAPHYARTMKVLQALASGKWIMSSKWIKEGKCSLVDQQKYGICRLENPITGKKVFLTETFNLCYDKEHQTAKHCQMLVEYCKGSITDKIEEADYCILGTPQEQEDEEENRELLQKIQEERENLPSQYPVVSLEWNEFVDLLYPLHYEQTLRKIEGN